MAKIKGQVKWFNEFSKGFGFITPADGSKERVRTLLRYPG